MDLCLLGNSGIGDVVWVDVLLMMMTMTTTSLLSTYTHPLLVSLFRASNGADMMISTNCGFILQGKEKYKHDKRKKSTRIR